MNKKMLLVPVLLVSASASFAIEGYVPNNKDEARAIEYLEKLGATFKVEIVPLPQYTPSIASRSGVANPAGSTPPVPSVEAPTTAATSASRGVFSPTTIRPGLSSKGGLDLRAGSTGGTSPTATAQSLIRHRERLKQNQPGANPTEAATPEAQAPALVIPTPPAGSYQARVSDCGGNHYLTATMRNGNMQANGYRVPFEDDFQVYLPPFEGGFHYHDHSSNGRRFGRLQYSPREGQRMSWPTLDGVPTIPAEDFARFGDAERMDVAAMAAAGAEIRSNNQASNATASPGATPPLPPSSASAPTPATRPSPPSEPASRATLTPARAAQQAAAARSRTQAAARARAAEVANPRSSSVAPQASFPHRKVIVGITFPKQEVAERSVSSTLHGKSSVAVPAKTRQPSVRRFGDRDVAVLRPFQSLKMLDLSHTDVTDRGIAELEKLRFKTFKDLPGLGLAKTRVTDRGVAMLAKFDDLERLDLSDTMVSDRGVYAMKSMKDMRQLDLSNTRITDRCSPFLAELWQLDTLKMAENTQVTNKGLTPLLKLKKLRSLDLGKTKVTPQAKAALQKRLSPCQVQ